jgi:transcriptional regulator with XRE-family HTH domain
MISGMKRTVAENIRQWRRDRELTQQAAAGLAGIGQSEWSRYESGERLPRLNRLALVAAALQITSAELIRGTDWQHFTGQQSARMGKD